jgi:hypothetical protein
MINQNSDGALQECEGFKEGDFIVVAGEHNHYLAIFNSHGVFTSVANFDGTKNYRETKQCRKELRKTLW